MFETGKDLWRSLGSALLLLSHLEHVVQHDVQTSFGCLQGWRTHNLLLKPVPGLSHPHSKAKLPTVPWSLPSHRVVSPTLGTTLGDAENML